MTEADTCREFVTPKLVGAGWGAAESVIGEQHSFTNGRIIVAGDKVRRGKQRRADYLLYYRRDFPLAIVEAKELGLPAEAGMQQAREYAEMPGLKFAYAANGHCIIEIDYTAGTEREVDRYASPDEHWRRLTASARLTEPAAAHLLEPFNLVSGKVPGTTSLGKIEVPLPPLAAQRAFNQCQAQVAALKAKHTAIRQANAAPLPSTLERVFAASATAAN